MEKTDFPDGFVDNIVSLLAGDDRDAFWNAMMRPPEIGVRFNCHKRSSCLPEWVESAERVRWCPSGLYLDHRPQFVLSPLWHQGCFYVQDPSSMIYESLVAKLVDGSHRPLAFLDLCAAPGGKTTAAMNSLPGESLVVANEYVGRRASILKENLIKYGRGELIVCNSDTSHIADCGLEFDIVVVDAPCSGEGMMRKEEEARNQWTPGLVRQCAALQKEILMDAWKVVRPGGYLIYSTCTFNRTENEENLSWLVENTGAEPVQVDFPEEWGIMRGIDTEIPCWRFMPHVTRGEGLFVAVVHKNPDAESLSHRSAKKDVKRQGAMRKIPLPEWVKSPDGWATIEAGTHLSLFPERWKSYLERLQRVANVIYCGVEYAACKGRDLVPVHPVAMSSVINMESMNCVEVYENSAIEYLRRNALPPFATDVPKGYVLIMYGGLPLGLVKNLGGRSNNLYPSEWRIRTL